MKIQSTPLFCLRNWVLSAVLLIFIAPNALVSFVSGQTTAQQNVKAYLADTFVGITVIPKHNFVDLATNPTELAGEHSLHSPERKQLLAQRLDAWLRQVEQDTKVLTPLGER